MRLPPAQLSIISRRQRFGATIFYKKPLRLTAFSEATYYLFFARAARRVFLMQPEVSGGKTDDDWMSEALEAALEARTRGEVPIGAVIVEGGRILAVAGNRTRTDCDPTAHAEIVALREAARVVGNYRLTGATVYSTIEPCAMCAGALVQARVRRLVYGALDERFGAVESQFRLCDSSSLNHRMDITAGVREQECRALMQEFFRLRRQQIKQQQSPPSCGEVA